MIHLSFPDSTPTAGALVLVRFLVIISLFHKLAPIGEGTYDASVPRLRAVSLRSVLAHNILDVCVDTEVLGVVHTQTLDTQCEFTQFPEVHRLSVLQSFLHHFGECNDGGTDIGGCQWLDVLESVSQSLSRSVHPV